METIIGLLIVLLPLVFKLIGKRLEQAGQVQPQVEDEVLEEDWAETVRRYVEQQQAQAEVFVPSQAEVEPQKEKTVVEAPRVVPKKKSKPILIEEKKKEKEKIDVKKMIVYSEIMKPKYTE